MSHGIIAPLPRILPANGMTLYGQHIPGGTSVSSDAPSVHYNEEIFPDSGTFMPERWLRPDSKELEKYLVAFSKGPRQCLGIK
jgi:cytochrome P450